MFRFFIKENFNYNIYLKSSVKRVFRGVYIYFIVFIYRIGDRGDFVMF